MAAPSRPIEDSMVEQLTYLAKLDGKVDAEEQKQLDEAETVRKQMCIRDRGEINHPLTPPYVRFRIRRFVLISNRVSLYSNLNN